MSVDTVIADLAVVADPPSELQAVVDLAAFVAGVPLATINILTSREQHQIAATGFDPAVCRREDSMCAVTVEVGEPIVLEDASLDDRFRANPFVTGEIGSVRFYAAHPLRLPSGEVLGTLCVFDTLPHVLPDERRQHLATLANRIVGVILLAHRSRELRESLHETELLRDELRRSNEHLSAFAGQVSHDLASPLASIMLSMDLVAEHLESIGQGSDDVAAWLTAGVRGAERMQAMIGDFLTFARVGGAAEPEPTDLAEVVADVADDLGLTGDPRWVVGPLPVVLGEARRLGAVVQNLVTNALKYGAADATVQVMARRADGSWEVVVADRGPGLSAEESERVFEPLVRAHPQLPGTGLGLATCRRIVQSFGGTIGLRPRDGGGTEAWFRLPAA